MKKILILVVLLLAVGLCCEEMTFEEWNSKSPYDMEKAVLETDEEFALEIFQLTSFASEYYVPIQFWEHFLSVYEEYEQECYQDSFPESWIDCDAGWFFSVHFQDESNWKYNDENKHYHRNPTFQGFIEFIRNKIKEKK